MKDEQEKTGHIKLDLNRIFGLHWIEPLENDDPAPTKVGLGKPSLTHTKARLGKPPMRPSTMVGGPKPGQCPVDE